jgi:hypothetical protein
MPKTKSTLRKPVLPTTGEVLKFAEGRDKTKTPAKSGLVPEYDVRLTANIRRDLHLKLKIRAAEERTTIGELIERWVQAWKN